MRLNKTDVSKLAENGSLVEETQFPGNKFIYALQAVEGAAKLSATMNNNTLILQVPRAFVLDWPANDVVGLDAKMPVSATETLYLLIEKDFVCLDETTEDQSDNFENPNKIC